MKYKFCLNSTFDEKSEQLIQNDFKLVLQQWIDKKGTDTGTRESIVFTDNTIITK